VFSNISLTAVLAEAAEKFIAANPKSRHAHLHATEAMPGGNTRSVLFHDPFPLTMVRGEGCRLWDADGHCYVDMLGEYTAGLYGHSNPVIRAALDSALDAGWNFGGHGLMEARLADLICERFPSIDLVRFTNSGTEANMMAIATAVAVTGRSRVMVFDGGYHGGVLSFGGGGSPINAPYDWLVASYNDATTAITTDIACILVEPMQGSGGCIPGTPEFLLALRDGATSTGAILIFDEVMTSRMSAGGQQARLKIIPDMTTLGKYIGGGMSFGAFGGRREIMERYDPRRPDAFKHAGTFNNNVLTMAAGHVGLSRLFTPAAAENLFHRGEALRERLNAIAAGLPMRWTGLGSLLCAHLDGDLGELFFLDMLAAGFYLARRGMIALSLEITDTEQESFCAAVEEFVANRRPLLTPIAAD
jgi:glutamate-1-semialdehyde 2,1-aminomutase